RLEVVTGLGEARVVELRLRDRGGDGGLRALAEHVVLPPEGVRPAVLAADRDRGEAGGLQLLHVGVELVGGGRRRGDAGLLEQVLAVPEADDEVAVRPAVPLAVDLPALRGRAELADPAADLRRDVEELPGLDLGGLDAAAPLLVEARRVRALERGRDLRGEL